MKKDIDILKNIKMYCEYIWKTIARFGDDKKVFDSDQDYQNSVCMNLLQIGESVGRLSEDFKNATSDRIYWPAIKGMRNVLVHNYGAVDYDSVWNTAKNDLSVLHAVCTELIELYEE